ncbi:MAG: DsrE family protein [Candidatus Nanohaloarchaea archaeon]
MKVVFHLNSNDTGKQSETLGNIKNLREDETVDVEDIALVVNADAVDAVRNGSEAAEFLEDFISEGVEVKACSNSLDNREIGEEELLDGVETVSSGVGEIARLEDEGYQYIKP